MIALYNIGFCLTGSFCTFSAVFPVIGELTAQGHAVRIIFSHNAYANDTRFGLAADWIARAREISGKTP